MACPADSPVCASCAAVSPPGARFCSQCGARLSAPPALPEERKTVTVLFCDLVGFTAMSEQADPEDVDACLRAFGALAREVIERYGGFVEKFIGDAAVGVFGVPAVHEDDPERAVRAALWLLEGVEALARPDGGHLQARAGIMTGELLVAFDVDPASGNGFVAGDAVNTAQRLEASAAPGSVVVGELTRRLTENAIIYEELPPCSVKGKRAPLVRSLARYPRARVGGGAPARLSPLVGRDGELAFCGGLLRRVVLGGTPQVALILGDPGIGKSRLVRELFTMVDTGPEFIVWRQGRCVPYGEQRAFWALREIVQSHAGILETHDPEQAADLLERAVDEGPDHAWICERLRPLAGLDAADAADSEENYAAWLRFFCQVAAKMPLVLVVEDLHWADESLLAFMEYVAQHVADGPLLLVGTARPELLRDHPGFAASEGRVTRIWLDRLSDEETRSLVAALPEMEGAQASTVGLVARRAEGNPFFAEELARLVADGVAGDQAATLSPLPQSVAAVIAARIDALSPQAKAALADGAIVGAVFWRGALDALAWPPGDSGPGLAELVERQLIRPARQSLVEGEEEFAFCHGLVREVAYGEVPRAVRARKHVAFARWLEDKVGERARGDLCDVLAWHYGAAAELARAAGDALVERAAATAAVDYLGVSGDRAMGLDVRAASRHFLRALALVGPRDPGRPALLPRAAEALFQEGRYRESAGILLEAAAGLAAAGDRRAAALAGARRADVLYALGDPGVTQQLEEALALLDGDRSCPEAVTVLGKLGRSLWLAGDARGGLERLEEALELAGRLRLPEPVLFLGYRGGIRCIMGDVGGLEDYERALAVAGERGRVDEASLLTFNYADALLSYRGPEAALGALFHGLDAARRRRMEAVERLPAHDDTGVGKLGEWDAETDRRLSVNLVEALCMLGEWDRTLLTAAELTPELERSEAGSDLVIVRAQEALVHTCRGEAHLTAPYIDWLERHGRESEIPWIAAYALLSAGPARFGLGQEDAALGLLDDWERRPRPGSGPNYVAYLPAAVRATLAAGDSGLAERLAAGVETTLPMQRNVRASLSAALHERRGRTEEAAGLYAHAAARWREFAVPREEAQALLGRGRCLTALGRRGEAAEPLGAARGIFARLEARPALAEIEGLLAG